MKELAKGIGYFVVLGGILIIASIIYDIFNHTLVATFMFFTFLFPILFVFTGVIREGLFYKESDIGYYLLHVLASVVSGLSVTTIINLIMIKSHGVKYIHNIIDHDIFASDGYQAFLSWIRSGSRYKNASPIAKIFDFNRSFKWFSDIMPKPDTLAFTVVMIVAIVLALLGILLILVNIRKIYLVVPSYLIFTPILLFLLTMICNIAFSIAIAVIPVFGVLLFALVIFGGSSESVAEPSKTGGQSGFMLQYGDVGEMNYRINYKGDNYMIIADEQGNQISIHQSSTDANKYYDENGNVYHFSDDI